jgi:hypothetical protein
MPRGRPTLYTEALAADICSQLANGKTLTDICKQDGYPCRDTVNAWMRDQKRADFAAAYARARDEQADWFFEEILATANETTNENAQAQRVKIDALKWVSSRLAPKKYGERVAVGGDENAPPIRQEMVITRRIVRGQETPE